MKSVITCAGKGTRLLPFTKELPKEMAPIFSLGENGIEIKPLIQQIFENYHLEFCKHFFSFVHFQYVVKFVILNL